MTLVSEASTHVLRSDSERLELRCEEPPGSGFRVQGFGFWVWGLGFRVQGFGFRV